MPLAQGIEFEFAAELVNGTMQSGTEVESE